MKKYLALILAVLMLAAAFAGCGETETESDPEESAAPEVSAERYGTFRDYFTAFPSTLNSFALESGMSTSETNEWLQAKLYNDRATADGESWEYWCEMAEERPQMMDTEGKVWRVKLRDGLKWENGDTFDADDVIYSIRMKCDPTLYNTAGAGCGTLTYFRCLNLADFHEGKCSWDEVGIRKIDDLTIEFESTITANQVGAMKFANYATFVYEPLFESCLSEDRSVCSYGTDASKYMASGPYKIEEWIPDAKFVLVPNENYTFQDEITFERVELTYVPNAATALQLFLNGELDHCDIAYTDWEQFEDDPRVYEYFEDSNMYMFVNLANPSQNNILGDLNYRKAIYYGCDRSEIAETMGVYPSAGYIRRAVMGNVLKNKPFVEYERDYIPDPTTIFNPELANEYLNKALEAKGLTSATVEFLQSESATFNKAVHEMLIKQFENVFGDKLVGRINQVPSTIQLRRWNPDNPTSYEIAIGSMLPSADDPRSSFYCFTSDYNPPRVLWNNPEYDAIYNKSILLDQYDEDEAEEIVELCRQMEKILLDDLVIIPVYEAQTKVLFSERIVLPVNHYVIGFGFDSYRARIKH